jgi:hypothetical protein
MAFQPPSEWSFARRAGRVGGRALLRRPSGSAALVVVLLLLAYFATDTLPRPSRRPELATDTAEAALLPHPWDASAQTASQTASDLIACSGHTLYPLPRCVVAPLQLLRFVRERVLPPANPSPRELTARRNLSPRAAANSTPAHSCTG